MDFEGKYYFNFRIHLRNKTKLEVMHTSNFVMADDAIKEMLGEGSYFFTTRIKGLVPLMVNVFDIVYIECFK